MTIDEYDNLSYREWRQLFNKKVCEIYCRLSNCDINEYYKICGWYPDKEYNETLAEAYTLSFYELRQELL